MLLKLAALGTLGYVAYRFIDGSKHRPRIELAGGPLSDRATIQTNPDEPPAAHLYDGL